MAIGRFAPSPTGPLHLGNLRTALIAWLFARSAGSSFLLRVEDLDVAASRREHEVGHRRDLEGIGLEWDGPVIRQSERFEVYRSVLDDLRRRDLLYPCYCTRREVAAAVQAEHGPQPEGAYPGTCRQLSAKQRAAREADGRPPALRLRGPGDPAFADSLGTPFESRGANDGAVGVGAPPRTGSRHAEGPGGRGRKPRQLTFEDAVAGSFTSGVDDFVVQRNDGAPAYNLAVVVDDHLQRVEEVVRGDDLLATTPRQIHLTRVLGWETPSYAHVPLVLGPDGERLAKRHGAVTLADCARLGIDASRVRDRLVESLGDGAPSSGRGLEGALGWFRPDRLSRQPWVLDGTPDQEIR